MSDFLKPLIACWILPATGAAALAWGCRYCTHGGAAAKDQSMLVDPAVRDMAENPANDASVGKLPDTAVCLGDEVFDLLKLTDSTYRAEALLRFNAALAASSDEQAFLFIDALSLATLQPVNHQVVERVFDDFWNEDSRSEENVWQKVIDALHSKLGKDVVDGRFSAAFDRLYAGHPEQALAMARSMPGFFRTGIVQDVYAAEALKNPEAIIDKLVAMRAGDEANTLSNKGIMMLEAFSSLAARDPAAAVARWQGITDPDLQASALEGLSLTWAKKDPAAYYKWADALPGQQRRLSMKSALPNTSPDAIREYLATHKEVVPGLGSEWTAHHFSMSKLAENHPVEALTHFTEQKWPPYYLDKFWLYWDFAKSALTSEKDRPAITKAVLDLPEGHTRRKLLDELLVHSGTLARDNENVSWVHNLTAEQTVTLLKGASLGAASAWQKMVHKKDGTGLSVEDLFDPSHTNSSATIAEVPLIEHNLGGGEATGGGLNYPLVRAAGSLVAAGHNQAAPFLERLTEQEKERAYFFGALKAMRASGGDPSAAQEVLSRIPDHIMRQQIERRLAAQEAGLRP